MNRLPRCYRKFVAKNPPKPVMFPETIRTRLLWEQTRSRTISYADIINMLTATMDRHPCVLKDIL